MLKPSDAVKAQDEFYKIAVCGKTACPVRRRGIGANNSCLYSTVSRCALEAFRVMEEGPSLAVSGTANKPITGAALERVWC
jgi:hypothetical protein